MDMNKLCSECRKLTGLPHQKECGQQDRRSDFAPLLWSVVTPCGVLCPALGPSTQETHGHATAHPEEATKMLHAGAGATLLEDRLREFSPEKTRL